MQSAQQLNQLILQRLFQNDGGSWIQLVYLVAMFAVVIWRKESIVNWGLFRASYLFFGASLVVPSIVLPIVQWIAPGVGFPGSGPIRGLEIGTQIFMNAVGPACFAFAVICGLACMAPTRTRVARPVQAVPHPLD